MFLRFVVHIFPFSTKKEKLKKSLLVWVNLRVWHNRHNFVPLWLCIFYADGTTLSLLNQSAPPKTQLVLGMALLIGAILFSPILLYLFLFLNVLWNNNISYARFYRTALWLSCENGNQRKPLSWFSVSHAKISKMPQIASSNRRSQLIWGRIRINWAIFAQLKDSLSQSGQGMGRIWLWWVQS